MVRKHTKQSNLSNVFNTNVPKSKFLYIPVPDLFSIAVWLYFFTESLSKGRFKMSVNDGREVDVNWSIEEMQF